MTSNVEQRQTRETDNGIWVPETIQPCSKLKKASLWRRICRRLGIPYRKVHESFFDHLGSDVLIYFLNHLTSSGDIDTLRRLLHADPKLKRLVVNILDNTENTPYMSDVDPLDVEGVPRITLKEFRGLNLTSGLRVRPIRIFTIRDCGIGLLPNSISEFRSCEILPYLTRNTPVIIKTFGEDSLSAKRAKKWSESLPVKFPLILIQDYDPSYMMFDLSRVSKVSGPLQIKPPEYLDIERYDREYESWPKHAAVEIQNIPDHVTLRPSADIFEESCDARIISLSFTGKCTDRHGDHCCKPDFRLPVISKALRKLVISFDGPRFPAVVLKCEDTTDSTMLSRFPPPPKKIVLVNNNWSESNPFGVTCVHSRDEGLDASQWCANPLYVPEIKFINGNSSQTSKVEYIGMPDGALRLLAASVPMRKFIWRRMSPTKPAEMQYCLNMSSLKELSLFTLVREGELLPQLLCPKLEKLTLVALENSVGGFDLANLFDGARLKKLTSVRIVGPQLSRMCPDLAIVSKRVEKLFITGYVPQFVIDSRCYLEFPRLTTLKIDISQIPTVTPKLLLELKNERFPSLRILNLYCSWKFSRRFNAYDGTAASIELELADSCVGVRISSLVNIKDIVINRVKCTYEKSLMLKGTYLVWSKGRNDKFSYAGLQDCSDYLDPYSE